MIERFSEGPFRTQDLGYVTAVDEPAGVSWVDFAGLALTDYGEYRPEEGHTFRSEVPVSTQQLTHVKGEQVVVGDYFWGDVNVSATSQADVDPSIVEFSPDPGPEAGEDLWDFPGAEE